SASAANQNASCLSTRMALALHSPPPRALAGVGPRFNGRHRRRLAASGERARMLAHAECLSHDSHRPTGRAECSRRRYLRGTPLLAATAYRKSTPCAFHPRGAATISPRYSWLHVVEIALGRAPRRNSRGAGIL